MAAGGLFSDWTRGKGSLRVLRWALLLVGSSILGLLFGDAVPAILILLAMFIVVGVLYVVLWALIWLVGRFFPTWRLVDLKIALRSMLVARGRGASTLLALVIGVFTLSLLTMLTSVISAQFEQTLVNEAGGNVMVLAAGQGGALERVEARLGEVEGVTSSAVVGAYGVELLSLREAHIRRMKGEGLARVAEGRLALTTRGMCIAAEITAVLSLTEKE